MIFSYNDIIIKKIKNSKITYDVLFNYGITTIKSIVKNFADTINDTFIDQLFQHNDINFIFYTTDNIFSIKKTIGIIIYTKTNDKIYLLLICIDKKYRNFGYGKVFLEEFIQYVKNTYKKNKKIILHTIDKTISFYESIGFIQINCKPYKYKKIFKYEKYNKNINLMEFNL